MGMLNDHVRMGAPLADILPFATRVQFKSLGMIRELGIIGPNDPMVQPLEGVGIIGGGGLLAGSFLLKKGTPSTVMMVAGILGLAAGVLSIGIRAMSGPSSRLPLVPTAAAPAPSGPTGLIQTLVSDYKQYQPAVKEVKNLFAPAA